MAAVDQDPIANDIYATHHGLTVQQRNLVGVKEDWLAAQRADLWWMSPPCQPYTVRGRQKDLDDPRAYSLIRLLDRLQRVQPRFVAMENVPGFRRTRAHALVRETLAGYDVRETVLCPTELGVPNQRRRFYLVAGRDGIDDIPAPTATPRPLAAYVADDGPPVDPDTVERFGAALHVVDAADPHAVAACFTSAYGRSPVYAGSYLRQNGRLRRFHPREIAALLHFPDAFALPDALPLSKGWGLVGNSLSVAAVRHVLRAVPGLMSA